MLSLYNIASNSFLQVVYLFNVIQQINDMLTLWHLYSMTHTLLAVWNWR